MSFVITLVGYVPSPRFDGVPWTQAQIAYSATEQGPFTPFDTLALSPVDADPTAPQRRNLTSVLAPAAGWFQVTFLDDFGGGDPTSPVRLGIVTEAVGAGIGPRTSEANQNPVYVAGSTQVSTIRGAAPDLARHLTWRLISDKDGSTLIAESGDSIVEIDDGVDAPMHRYDRPFTVPLLEGRYLAIWRSGQEEIAQNVIVAESAEAAFATPGDVAARLGRALTADEDASVTLLLTMAAAVIADAAGYDDGWAVTLDPVPQMLRGLSVELVNRALKNPGGYSQITQTVGSYSFSGRQDTVGMNLSEVEVLMVRRAIHGRTTDVSHIESGFERAQDEYWMRKQSVRFADPQDPASVIP